MIYRNRYWRDAENGNRRYRRARQHIREAEEFSREIGGCDEEVKAYFFSLPAPQLEVVLNAYGATYGEDAKNYAEETMGKWQSGERRMSGMVARRLFGMLPPVMPLEEKYRLTEKLWKHTGPTSKKQIRVGTDATVEQIAKVVHDHISTVVIQHEVPEEMENRFRWLSQGDVKVRQQLLNHLREQEKTAVVETTRRKLPVILAHMHADRHGYTRRITEVLKVGNHELEVLVEQQREGVELRDPPPRWEKDPPDEPTRSHSTLWWSIAALTLVALWILNR